VPGPDADDALRRALCEDPHGPRGQEAIADASLRAELCGCALGVRQYLLGMCGDADRAMDLSQEALLKAWRARAGFAGNSSVKTWLFSIARNVWLDYLRRKSLAKTAGTSFCEKGMEQLEQQASASVGPLAAAGRSELYEHVRQAMEKLPHDQREALSLRQSQGMKFHEVAALLGVPVATVKSRVRYALLKLADELERYRDEIF
jgi:RNA polymerase sigma-70 factor (ECF subfamily)